MELVESGYIQFEYPHFSTVLRRLKAGRVEVSRFKGLGEMPPAQLKETTMNPASRRLLRVDLPLRNSVGADLRRHTDQLVNTLMGKKAELRFSYIRDHADDVLANLDF